MTSHLMSVVRSPRRPLKSQRKLVWVFGFAFAISFVVICFLFLQRNRVDLTPRASDGQAPETINGGVVQKFEHSDTSATDGFINAWRQDRETCRQWISVQRMASSYLDAYIIGSQKGATSEITKRLFNLGVRRPDMKKEWHYFNRVAPDGTTNSGVTTHLPINRTDLKQIRFDHYKTGFPDDEDSSIDSIPLVDNSDIENRTLAYDGTVEHLHTDKAAFMAHALTPHAKIVATVRDPIARAISQFNMVVRTFNSREKQHGRPTRQATADWFHEIVEHEINNLKRCGYDATLATVDRPTSKMLSCMFGEEKLGLKNLLYVTRGLYHIHIATWRNYFPDHRILILSFHDIAEGKREAHQDLTKFLCIRPFSEDWLKEFEESGSSLSYGQQVAKGMENRGVDHYDSKEDSYMVEIGANTRKMLNDFYRPANEKLEALLGRKVYEYD